MSPALARSKLMSTMRRISTNKVNSASKLIEDDVNGYLLENLEGEKFANSIDEVLKLDSFKACVSTAKENTIEKMTEIHVNMINEVLGK